MSEQKSKSMTSSLTGISSSSPDERALATQAETLEWHKKRWPKRSSNLLLPPLPCPAFSSLAVMEDGVSEWIFTSDSLTEDYVLLLFLPMDGSVDKSEVEAFSAELDQLSTLGCQVVAISGDNVAAIRQWLASAPASFPILSDKSLNIAKSFGAKRQSGMMTRATFLLNKERKVCYSAVLPRCVARTPKEMVRQVTAVRELDSAKEGTGLPAGWQDGDEALPVGLEETRAFLGLDDQQMEEKRDGMMGEPKVVDTIGLFDYMVKDVGGPRDLSHFLGTAFLGRHLLETANLGLDIQLMGDKKLVEERSSGARQNWEKRSMGVPEVVDSNSLFNYVVKDVGGPRDLSHFLGTATLGLDIQQMGEEKQVSKQAEEKRSMGVPEVVDTISLFNYLMRDVDGPRDLSYFLQGL